MNSCAALHTRYGERLSHHEAERRFYCLEALWFSISLRYTNSRVHCFRSLHEGDYSYLARCHESLVHLAAQPSVRHAFNYAMSEDLPLEKTLIQRINIVQNSIVNFLSENMRDARPLRMGHPEEIENKISD